MMVFGKQNVFETAERTNLLSTRTFHLSINERKPDESSVIHENSSSIVSKLLPIQTENISLSIGPRSESTSLLKTQAIVRIDQ